MLAGMKREVTDWLKVAAILVGIFLVVALVFGGVAFELLKAWALIKFVFFW